MNVFANDAPSDLHLCMIEHQPCQECQPLVVTRTLVVASTFHTWQVYIHGHLLNPSLIPLLCDLPLVLNVPDISLLLSRLSNLSTCVGNTDHDFVDLSKSKKNEQFLSPTQNVVGYLDRNACVCLNGEYYPLTVRSSQCHLLVDNSKLPRCPACSIFRNNLRALLSRSMRHSQIKLKTNFR